MVKKRVSPVGMDHLPYQRIRTPSGALYHQNSFYTIRGMRRIDGIIPSIGLSPGSVGGIKKRKIFEPLESVTIEDIKEIVAESLSRNHRVYDRLAEI